VTLPRNAAGQVDIEAATQHVNDIDGGAGWREHPGSGSGSALGTWREI
jgi:hypothetical protein